MPLPSRILPSSSCFSSSFVSCFITVGQSGTVLTSSDGKYWTLRNSGTSNELNGITYGNGMFLTVGEDPIVIVSSNLGDLIDLDIFEKTIFCLLIL